MKTTLTLIAAVILLASSTPAIQSVIFKPQRPAAVHVKTIATSNAEDVSEYIEGACKKGWIVKAISQSPASGINNYNINYTIVFEAY